MITEHVCPSCAPLLEALSARVAALEAHVGLAVPEPAAIALAEPPPAPEPIAETLPLELHPAHRKVPPADVPGLLHAILTEGLSLQDAGRRYEVPGSYIGRLCEREAAARGRMVEWLNRPRPRGRPRTTPPAPAPSASAPPPPVWERPPPVIQREPPRPVAPLPRYSLEGRTWCPACGRKLEQGTCPGDLCEYRARPQPTAAEGRR